MPATHTLFDPADRASMLQRIRTLRPDSPRQWGKMTPAQMLAHCTAAIGDACGGDRETRQVLIGRLIGRLALKRVLGGSPMPRNAPTTRRYLITDERDFDVESARLTDIIERLGAAGPSAAASRVHVLFGPLTGDQWGRLLYKHLDHHLRQFKA